MSGETVLPNIGYKNASEIPMQYDGDQNIRRTAGFWTTYYKIRFRWLGIRYGAGLIVRGRLLLQIDGKAENLHIGKNVTLMPGVHLKNRENGTIFLHDRVTLDTNVRLVAANNAHIMIGENASVGMGSIINAGDDVIIGRGTITAGYCYINVSDHNFSAGTPIRSQGFKHAPISIGEDAWLGAYVFVLRGARVGHGAVVAATSVVSGDIPRNAIVQGQPAKIIKYRE